MNFERGFGESVEVATDDIGAMVSRRRRIFAIIAAMLVIGIALFIMIERRTAPAPDAPALPHVTVIVPGQQQVASTVSVTGTLAARREMPVGIAGEGGMVSRVLVEAGDRVQAGQTLATVERSVQVEQTNQTAAQVAAARADAAIASSNLERARALVGRGFISKADLDQKTATRDAAVARVKLAQAQLGEARARLGRLDVRAPTDGLVLTRSVEAGQIVGPTSGALFKIAERSELELLARLAEQDLARLSVGATAQVTPVGSNRSFNGQIWQLSPVIDPTTRQGVARIALHYDPALRPGGFASTTIISGKTLAPVLPESAVMSDDKGNFVYVIDRDSKVVRRDVKTGQVSDMGIAIVSGLDGRERVVFSAGAFLSPGDKVVPELKPARQQ
jgi:RND family efflux transporter MFP subunit